MTDEQRAVRLGTKQRAAILMGGSSMESEREDRLVTLLQDIRRGQQEQLEIQREHLEIARTQYDRANAINDRAERIQAKSDALIERSGKVFKVVIPALILLLAGAGWLLFTMP